MGTTVRLCSCLALLGTFVIEDPFYCSEPPDHRQLAIAHLEQGNFDQALMSARRATRQHREDGSIFLIVALAHLGRERADEAFAALAQAAILEPENTQIHATLRQIFGQEERFDAAADVYEHLLERHPETAAGLVGLGWALLRLGEEERGAELLRRGIDAGDSTVFARVQLARLYAGSDSLEQVTRMLSEAVEIDPDNLELLLALGEYHLRSGDDAAAVENLGRALQGSDQPAKVATHIAQLHYNLGSPRRAIEYYEKAIAIDPDQPMVLNNLAWTYAEEELQIDRALELSLRSLKADADNVVYLDTYAELLYKQGQHDRAIAMMRRALEIEPEEGEHYTYLREQMEKFQLADSRL